MLKLAICTTHGKTIPIEIDSDSTPNELNALLIKSTNLDILFKDNPIGYFPDATLDIKYFYSGKQLNPSLSLKSQKVTNDSKIIILPKLVFTNKEKIELPISDNLQKDNPSTENEKTLPSDHKLNPDIQNSNMENIKLFHLLQEKSKSFTPTSVKISSLVVESLKVFDQYFTSIDRCSRPQISYQKMLEIEEEQNDREKELIEIEKQKELEEIRLFFKMHPEFNQNQQIQKDKLDAPSVEPLPNELPVEHDENEEYEGFVALSMFGSIEEAGKFFSKFISDEWSW